MNVSHQDLLILVNTWEYYLHSVVVQWVCKIVVNTLFMVVCEQYLVDYENVKFFVCESSE